MEKPKILVVDDEKDMLENCVRILDHAGYQCYATSDTLKALELIDKVAPDLALVDLRMPQLDGIGLLRAIKGRSPGIVVVLITAYGTVQTALESVKGGAFDHLAKPFTAEQLREVVSRALDFKQSARNAGRERKKQVRFDEIIGSSPAIKRVLELVENICDTPANVIVYGESGSGKELIARAIHYNSLRTNAPFVPIDCASLPETLLESELFGYEKGAFTDAYKTQPGLIEFANGGTLFLDEVAELTPALQAKLLRVLEERKVRRLGGRELIDVDVRIISATNRDLREMVERRQFRQDLYFRLNVVSLRVPPLRERVTDVPALAQHFLRQFCQNANRKIDGISAAAMLILQQYSWPGNVRELRNTIERAASLAASRYILPTDLPEELLSAVERSGSFGHLAGFQKAKSAIVEQFEREYLTELLARTKGNIPQAAELAAMHRTAFYRLLRKHGIISAKYKGQQM